MTVPIQETTIQANTLVTGFSRYLNSPVIYWGETPPRMAFETYVRKPYVKTNKEKIGVIPPGYQYRPDKIANDYYGTPDLWWKVMEANGIYDIADFVAGVTIFLPELS